VIWHRLVGSRQDIWDVKLPTYNYRRNFQGTPMKDPGKFTVSV